MDKRLLGRTGIGVTPIGFGAFKIGRNQGIKYPRSYDLPDEDATAKLLHRVLDLGVNYIDTAPAYGLSEERIGRHLAGRRGEFILSTKAGETFRDGQSTYDFTPAALRSSMENSLRLLRTERVDILFLHSNGDDLRLANDDAIAAQMLRFKEAGQARAVGFSGKLPAGAQAAMNWADVLMVEYHCENTSHDAVMREANQRGIGVVVKKGLGSGRLDATHAIRFVLAHPAVQSVVVGTLNADHLQKNIAAAENPISPP